MFLEQRLIGTMANFGYLIGDPEKKVAAVIEPSFDARILELAARENGYASETILNTHHHPDHVFDNERLADETGAKIAAHRLSMVPKDILLEDGQILPLREGQAEGAHNPRPPAQHGPEEHRPRGRADPPRRRAQREGRPHPRPLAGLVLLHRVGPRVHGGLSLRRGLRPRGPAGVRPAADVRLPVQQGPEDGRRPRRVPGPPLRADRALDGRAREGDEPRLPATQPRGVPRVHGPALARGEVRGGGLLLRLLFLRLLPPRLPLSGRGPRPLPLPLPVLRGALHVQAEYPGRASAHDDLDHGMPARLAPVLRGDDEPPLGQRVGIVAVRVRRASDEPLPAHAVADRQLACSALLALADEVRGSDRRAVGGHAERRRAPAIRVSDHGRAALRARLRRALDGSRLREGMRVPALGVPRASEEARPAPRSADHEVSFLADVALPDVVLLHEGRRDLLPDRLAVLLERFEDVAEHLLGLPDDVLAGPDPRGDPVHVRLKVGRHLGPRDPLRVVLEGLDHGLAARRRFRVPAFDELPLVQLLDDIGPRGLPPEPEPFHLLDQGPFAVPGRGLRPVLTG